MAKSDAEISLKVNMPPPNEFTRKLQQFEKLAAGVKNTLNGFGHEIKDVADGVRIVGERARATGSANIINNVQGRFSQGFGEASSMDKKAEDVAAGLETLEGRVADVKKAFEENAITEAEAVELMQKYTAEVTKAEAVSGNLYYTLHATKADLLGAEAISEMLGKYGLFTSAMSDVNYGARELAKGLREQADAFAEERDALDAAAPGYEQQAARLMVLEAEYRKMAKDVEGIGGSMSKAQQKAVAALNAFDGSAEAQQRVYAAIEEGSKSVADAEGKLEGLATRRQLNEQKRAADAERIANREREIAEQREKREQEMAARDAERAEIEKFNMELSLLNKDQLIKKLQELQAAREAAAKADDKETYKKRTREFMAVREQMEKVNVQLNVTRLAWTQQAQMANSFAGSLQTVATGLGSLGEQAENGELDLVGLASGAQQAGTALVSMVQAGLGPLGLLTLALQGVQFVWNKLRKEEKAREEQSRNFIAWQKEMVQTQEKNRREVERYNEALSNKESLNAMLEFHRELNAELNKEIAAIDKATQAELHRMRLSRDEAAHKMAMKKDELGRKLMSGEITQAQYNEQMAVWQRDEELRALDEAEKEAQVKRETAEKRERLMREAYAKRSEDFDTWNKENKRYAWDDKRLALFEAQYKDAEATLQEKTDKLNKLREEGASEVAIADAKKEMQDALRAREDISKEFKAVLLGTYGRGHKMSIEEGLEKYAQDMENAAEHLKQATQLKEAAAQDLAEAEAAVASAVAEVEQAGIAKNVQTGYINERYESGKKTREARTKTDRQKEKNAKRLEDLRNKADMLTEDELKAEAEAARKKRDAAKNELERAFYESKVKIYSERVKSRRDSERERLNEAVLENSLQGDARKRGIFEQMDLQAALNTMDDGRISKSELRLLKKQYDMARAADNKAAIDLLNAIIEDAKESKKMNGKMKRRVVETLR